MRGKAHRNIVVHGRGVRGFTLVELLVVIAIIGVLITLQMPSLSKIKEVGRRTACASQLHQIHVAQMAYAAAHQGEVCPAMPGKGSVGGYGGAGTIWRSFAPAPKWSGTGLLWERRYLTDMHVSYCPSSEHPKIRYDDADIGFNDGKGGSQTWVQQSYHMRGTVDIALGGGGRQPMLNRDSPGLAFMADSWSFDYGLPNSSYPEVEWHHRTGYNVLYLDGACTFLRDPQREIPKLQISLGAIPTKWNWSKIEQVWLRKFDR